MCEHGAPLYCQAKHQPGDSHLGEALCADCYDYVGHILWHTAVPELWRRFIIAVPRALARLRWERDRVRVKAADVVKQVRVSYVKVAEWQRRAAVHLHTIIRLDGVDPDDKDAVIPPPEWVDAALLDAAIREAAAAVWVDLPSPYGTERIARWGEQLDIRTITDPRKVAAYLAKYATKTASDTLPGLPVRPFSSVQIARLRAKGVSWHLLILAGTCLRLAVNPECVDLNLADRVHTLGFSGHFATKSRRYSTTLKHLKAVRRAWRAEQRGGDDVWSQAGAEVVGDWRLIGVGYRNSGDALLAEQMARDEATYKQAVKEHDVMRIVVLDEPGDAGGSGS